MFFWSLGTYSYQIIMIVKKNYILVIHNHKCITIKPIACQFKITSLHTGVYSSCKYGLTLSLAVPSLYAGQRTYTRALEAPVNGLNVFICKNMYVSTPQEHLKK